MCTTLPQLVENKTMTTSSVSTLVQPLGEMPIDAQSSYVASDCLNVKYVGGIKPVGRYDRVQITLAMALRN